MAGAAKTTKYAAWANSPGTYISNGPYVLTKFELQNESIIKKNPIQRMKDAGFFI